MTIAIALLCTLLIALLFGRLLADSSRRWEEQEAAIYRQIFEFDPPTKETPMFEYDSNGIALKPDGGRIYKRYAELMVDGRRMMGGIYIGQSTTEEYLVELHEVEASARQGGYTTEVWKPTGQLASVHLSNVVRVFEPHANPPPEPSAGDVDGLARFILNTLNIAPIFIALRAEIALKADLPPAPKGYSWEQNTVGLLLSLPQAHKLITASARSYDRICAACRVLDRAVELMRGGC